MKVALRDHRGKFGGTWDGTTLVFDRDRIGEGETFELVILDGDGDAVVISPPPQPPPPVVDDDRPEPTAAYVGRVKARLVAAGADLLGPCGAFAVTQRVAWGLRDQGWGLVESKPPHNNCSGYKVDVVMHRPSGQWIDCIVLAETKNEPAWNPGPGPMPAEVWRAPIQP